MAFIHCPLLLRRAGPRREWWGLLSPSKLRFDYRLSCSRAGRLGNGAKVERKVAATTETPPITAGATDREGALPSSLDEQGIMILPAARAHPLRPDFKQP